jgi:DNA-binding IclR family transcriptional regulator
MARALDVPGVSRRRVLRALVSICADGWPANVREVADGAGLRSSGSAHRLLLDLEEMGLAQPNPRWPSRRGGWKPTEEGIREAE